MRLEHEAATVLAVEQGAEDTRRVEIGKAEPFDRPISGDERDRASVADRAIVTDRRIAFDPLRSHAGKSAAV
jgi:hypothetical protein